VSAVFGFVVGVTVDDRTHDIATKRELSRKATMAAGVHKNWRELCNAALETNDPDELLKILQELNRALKREEQVRRDFREAMTAHKSSDEIRFNAYRKVTTKAEISGTK